MHVNTQIHDDLDLVGQQGPIEPVLGNAEQHHPAQLPGGFVHGYLIAETAQVVRGRQPGRTTPDDPDTFRSLDLGRCRHLFPNVAALGLRPKLLGDEAFESPDGDGAVNLAAPAGIFTRCCADPSAYRSERIRQPGRQIGQLILPVGDGGHVHPGVGMDRTSGQAGNIFVVELQLLAEHEIACHQIRSVLCSQIRPPIPAASITIHKPDPIRSPTSRGAPAMISWVIVQEGSHVVASAKNKKIKTARP